jgi:hypothetical protein
VPLHGFRTAGVLMRRELNVLALIKADERYVFIYDDASRAQLIDFFRDQAADPALNFNWFDAAVLTDKARRQACSSPEMNSSPRSRIGS